MYMIIKITIDNAKTCKNSIKKLMIFNIKKKSISCNFWGGGGLSVTAGGGLTSYWGRPGLAVYRQDRAQSK